MFPTNILLIHGRARVPSSRPFGEVICEMNNADKCNSSDIKLYVRERERENELCDVTRCVFNIWALSLQPDISSLLLKVKVLL